MDLGTLVFISIVAGYLYAGVRRMPGFARGYVESQLAIYPNLYRDASGGYSLPGLRRTAVWVGVGKGLFWVWIDIYRWITNRMVDNLTSEERKAKQVEEARKMIAEYDAEQAAKDKWDAQFNA